MDWEAGVIYDSSQFGTNIVIQFKHMGYYKDKFGWEEMTP